MVKNEQETAPELTKEERERILEEELRFILLEEAINEERMRDV